MKTNKFNGICWRFSKLRLTFSEVLFNSLYCFSRSQKKLTLRLSSANMRCGKWVNTERQRRKWKESEKFFYRKQVYKETPIVGFYFVATKIITISSILRLVFTICKFFILDFSCTYIVKKLFLHRNRLIVVQKLYFFYLPPFYLLLV